MGYIKKTRTLFFVTSPRSPGKLIPEIRLLVERFGGKQWARNPSLQAEFMQVLARQDFFESAYNQKHPDLSARDRITRNPKALGFVDLDPAIALTDADSALRRNRENRPAKPLRV